MAIMEKFLLTNKVAVVTGSGRGIGRSIALAYAEAGANVVVAARRTEEINKVAEEIRAQGRKALAVKTDFLEVAQIETAHIFTDDVGTYGKLRQSSPPQHKKRLIDDVFVQITFHKRCLGEYRFGGRTVRAKTP